MKFTRMTINNFMAIGKTRLNLDNVGLVLLQGENRDDSSAASNGSGKSSILDALCWCLYGETARGETGDAIINSVAGKNTKVAVVVEDGGYAYVIQRFRKDSHNKNRLMLGRMPLPLLEGGLLEDLTLGTDKLTQGVVERLIGCPKSVFTAAIYAGQEQMPDLPRMTDKELKELIEESAGMTTLQAAYEVAKEQTRIAKVRSSDAVGGLTRAEGMLKDALAALKNAETNSAGWKARIEGEVADTRASIEKVQYNLVAQEISAKASTEKLAELALEKEEVEKTLLSLDGERKALAAAEAAYRTASSNKSAAAATARSLEARVREAKKHFDHIGESVGKPCGECGKAIEEKDLETARLAAKEKLRNLIASFRDAESVEKACAESEQNALADLEKTRARQTDTSALVARKRDIEARETSHKSIIKAAEDSKSELVKLQAQVKRLLEAENPHETYIGEAILAREAATAAVENSKKNVAETQKDLAIMEGVSRVYGPKGVRATILDTVTPFLNERTGKYLGALSDGNLTANWSTLSLSASGELVEKFSISVFAKSGADRFGLLSGGEKRKVRLACSMALQDLVASRATKPINLYMADEIDDALDAAGLERLMGILEEKAKERGTVIVVSHNELSDWIREQVKVVKEGGVSTLSGSMVF
jgi:DNA repair exonuclease SbcCD ATPase subunit